MFHLGVAFMAEGSPLVLDEAKVRQFLQQEVTVVTVYLNKSRKNGQNCVDVVTNYNSCRKCQNSPFHTFRSRSTRDARLTA